MIEDISVPLCFNCVHFRGHRGPGLGYACSAFPERIPQDIAMGEKSHTTPYPGDHGIQFEPKPGYDAQGRKIHA